MYRKKSNGWFKHFDFIIIDLLCVQFSYVLAYFFRHGLTNLYEVELYRNMALMIEIADLIVIFMLEQYKGVLRRGYYNEFVSVLKQMIFIELISSMYLFTIKSGGFSRVVLYLRGAIYLEFSYIKRVLWKNHLKKKMEEGGKRSLLVSGADQKEDPLDFVLWKPKKEGEPFWKSPWCDGRPGWHIECSVMSKKYLGDEIDIHAGGEDLIFPHHENEIAQSEAANGKPFAHYWMHNAFLNIDNHKMSKSAGNFFTVRDIVAKYDPMVLRFFMLSAHYRSPLNFSAELMEAAANSLERIRTAVATLQFKAQNAEDSELTEQEKELLAQAAGFEAKFDQAMDDDFNTADAIAAIFELVKFANTCGDAEHTKAFWEALKEKITTLSDVCGLIVEKKEELLDADVEALIEERQAARKAKNFARADEIRQQLLDMGIVLEDTREGVKWKRA